MLNDPAFYGYCLMGLTVASLLLRDRDLIVVALAVTLDWAIPTALIDWTGSIFPWQVFLCIDVAAALAILLPGTNRIGAMIALTYAIEIAAHMGFSISPKDYPAQISYWEFLHWTAWVQALLLLINAGVSGGKRIMVRRGVHRGVFHNPVGAAQMEGSAARGLADGE